MYKTDT